MLSSAVKVAPPVVSAVAGLVPQQVFFVDVPVPNPYPYILLGLYDPFRSVDEAVSGVPDALELTLTVTMVDTTPGNVHLLRENTRQLINPGLRGRQLAGAWVKLREGGTAIIPDTSVPKIPATDRHPFYAVDTYQVHRVA